MTTLGPADLAFLDQAVAEFDEAVHDLTVGARALVAVSSRVEAIGHLTHILESKYAAHPRVLAGLLATALARNTERPAAGG